MQCGISVVLATVPDGLHQSAESCVLWLKINDRDSSSCADSSRISSNNLPMEDFYWAETPLPPPPPPQQSLLKFIGFILSFQIFGFEIPNPIGISNNFHWGECRYFLEPQNIKLIRNKLLLSIKHHIKVARKSQRHCCK